MSKLKLLGYVSLLLIASANSVAQTSYTTTDLGTLGGASSYAYRMSDTGQVVGQADTATETHAFLYDSTHGMVDLGTLGGTFSMANGIRGNYVVGRSTIAGDANTHAFVYNLQTLAMQDIHTLIGATGGDSSAISLNSSGAGPADEAIRSQLFHEFVDRYFPAPIPDLARWRTAAADGRLVAGPYELSRRGQTTLLAAERLEVASTAP